MFFLGLGSVVSTFKKEMLNFYKDGILFSAWDHPNPQSGLQSADLLLPTSPIKRRFPPASSGAVCGNGGLDGNSTT